MTLNGTNDYTGGTTINAGTVAVNSASSLGATSGALTVNNGTLEVVTGFTTTRNINVANAASTIQVDAGQIFSLGGTLSGAGALNKSGAGTLTLTGANTFTGAATVNAGTLTLAAASGNALANTSGITVNSGGTLLLGANDQIGNATPVTLGGGTIAKGNYSEGAANTVGIGALTLTADSHLDFGTGTTGVLSFSSFSPGLNLDILIIDNWTGTAGLIGSGSTDRLIFNSDQSANLAEFSFTGYTGATELAISGSPGFYEIVPITPVPEPGTYAAAALAAIACGYKFIRRKSQR